MHLASFFGHSEAVQRLLGLGADVSSVAAHESRVTPLHSGAASQRVDLVAALLSAGADPDPRQTGGFTALHEAALSGNEAMVVTLLAAGADPTLASDDGSTAVSLAKKDGHGSLLNRLRPTG